jgi:hypothetical protein
MVDWTDFMGGLVCGILLGGFVVGSAAAFVVRSSSSPGKLRWK